MTVAELREELLKYPQDAIVVSFSDYQCRYIEIGEHHIAKVGMTDEGLFSVPMVAVG